MENIREFAWDDEIVEEGGNFVLLPEGDYDFTATKVERARFNGSEKMPPCNMAKVTFTIWGENDKVEITENFLLNSKMEWKLSALFLAIGLKKHGEPLRMNWNAVPNSTGKCHVYIDTYVKKDGSQGQSNKIKRFYAYDEAVQTLSPQPNQQQSYQQPVQYQSPPQRYQQPTGYNPNGTKWKAGQF